MFNIISNHVFQDGNKRTGLESAILFLKLNSFRINRELENTTIFDFTIDVGSGQISLDEVRNWFAEHTSSK